MLRPPPLTPMEFAGGGARSIAADVGSPMTRLARIFTKASYSPGDPSEEEVSQAWAEVETLTQGARHRRLGPGPVAAPPEPGDAAAAGCSGLARLS